ncbi:MAG: 5-formyltetrahydrofolate cyclo-ligase [Kiritimatiellia bacterium]
MNADDKTLSIDFRKADLRGKIKKCRAELKAEWIEEESRKAQDRLAGLPEFNSAETVLCYMAFGGEVCTEAIIGHCRASGKKLCVPVFAAEEERYRPARLTERTPIIAGPFGVPEPGVRELEPFEEVDFVVVPGVAFDGLGNRLGRGGGHYDRMLGEIAGKRKGRVRGCFAAGLGFEFQIEKRVPAGKRDIRLDAVVTEKRVMYAKGF